ncbi:hypothetical protein [Adlercreutzia sp. ZJ141]|nr:hypothetical protein [Adlercreutzia sp. ZJ141]
MNKIADIYAFHDRQLAGSVRTLSLVSKDTRNFAVAGFNAVSKTARS